MKQEASSSTITLVGFKDLPDVDMDKINKSVDSYAEKLSDLQKGFDTLHIHVKTVHDNANKVEMKVRAHAGGKLYATDVVDFNVYAVLDSALHKIRTEMER